MSEFITSKKRSQVYYWTNEWQKEECEAMAEYERGDFFSFETVEEALAFLEKADANCEGAKCNE